MYANCFGAPERDVLITDEQTVALAASRAVSTVVADEGYDADAAQQVNKQLVELAYSWTSLGSGPDPTVCDGVSAADLAGTEALVALLQPAARGILDARAALRRPSRITVAVPRTSDPRFDGVERLIGEGFAAAADVTVQWATVSDPRNEALVAKYAQTRNPALRPQQGVAAQARAAIAVGCVNALSRMRGRGPIRVLVIDYHPTAAFARGYRAHGGGPFGLVRFNFASSDLSTMVKAGDRALAPLRGFGVSRPGEGVPRRLASYVERHDDELRERFAIAGVDLWQVVGERLVEMAVSYAAWMRPRIRQVRRALLAGRVGAVLVPFEGPPEARLVLRVAQALEIPTLMINDGWRGDEHLRDGMDADRALAWSTSIARNYFARRRHGHPTIVTGNPRSDEARRHSRRTPSTSRSLSRVLVGSLAFSPSDLNCRRSDPERFLADVLEGISSSDRASKAHVVVKLHPADRPDNYQLALEGFPDLDLEIRLRGDVLDLFEEADLYVTTYSTSLLEAAAFGLPVVYYRVNRQRLQAPFCGDPVMAARTASSPAELASLIDAPDRLTLPDGEVRASWIEEHLGPTDGRCTERVAAALAADIRQAGRKRLGASPNSATACS